MIRRPTLPATLDTLMEEGLISPDARAELMGAHAATPPRPPWYVRALLGLGAWVAAFLAALAIGLMGLFDELEVMAGLGVMICGAGVALGRLPTINDFVEQLSLVLCLSGLAMAGMGAGIITHSPVGPLMTIATLSGLILVFHPGATPRFLMAITAPVSLVLLPATTDSPPIITELMGLVVVLAAGGLWLGLGPTDDPERGWTRWRGPVTYGVSCGALALAGLAGWPEARQLWFSPLSTVGITLGGLLAVWIITGERGLSPASPGSVGGMVALVALGAGMYTAPGIPAALVGALIGAHRRRPLFTGLCAMCLAGFLGLWYYNLSVTLLVKSLTLIAGGLVLLVVAFALRPRRGAPEAAIERRLRPLHVWVLLGLAPALGFPTWATMQKEQVIADGRLVLLQLAPVDPRSLMQGDYMILDYAIERGVDTEGWPRDGLLVLSLDADGVGSLVERVPLDTEAALPADQVYLRYRIRKSWDMRLGAESFFFQEGHAEVYEEARYGALRVDDAGHGVLVGLYDEERRRLEPPEAGQARSAPPAEP